MPELPEVETVRRSLLPILGRRIVAVDIREPRLRRRVSRDLASRTVGQQIVAVDRCGKYLLLGLSSADVVLAHLGMSGTLILRPAGAPLEPHDHVRFLLSRGRVLVFNDPRRFGLLRVGRTESFAELRCIGPDPLSQDFSAELLLRLTRQRRRSVKNLLMDQRLVAGIGNIYANEILFEAGVRPGRRAQRLRRFEIEAIVRATRRVLVAAIAAGGSSISDYRDGSGRPGYFQLALSVYDRAGLPCRRCGTEVRRVTQTGRSSFYCPHCQR